MSKPKVVRRAVVAAFLVYVVFGLPDGVFGPIWPNLRNDFGRSDSSLGLLSLAIAIGYGLGSLASSRVTELVGLHRVLTTAMAAATAALSIIAAAPEFAVVMVGYTLLGAGWGFADAALNAWVALTAGPRTMGMLHGSYGIGAFAGPLLATLFVADGMAWRGPLVACALFTGATVLALIATRRGFGAAETRPEIAGSGEPATARRALILLIVWFAIYVGIEVAIGSWAYTLLVEGRGRSEEYAGALTAAYWGGLMAGRFVLAVVGHRLHPERTIRHMTVIAIVAAALLWADPGGHGGLMLPVLGAACSVMFPVAMGRTAVYVGEARAARAVGYQIGGTTIGFTLLPALIGVLADRHGVGVSAPVFLLALGGLAAAWYALERTVRPATMGGLSSTSA
ncbi:MAG: MFS transporter [Acidimicrobiales bacterium]|nr:MFS transporter [Acidimicrobiales bacterium]